MTFSLLFCLKDDSFWFFFHKKRRCTSGQPAGRRSPRRGWTSSTSWTSSNRLALQASLAFIGSYRFLFFWFYRVLPGFSLASKSNTSPRTSSLLIARNLNGFYWVLLEITGFYRVFLWLLRATPPIERHLFWLHGILPGFTGFYWRLPTHFLSSFGFYWTLPGFTGFYWVFLQRPCSSLLWFGWLISSWTVLYIDWVLLWNVIGLSHLFASGQGCSCCFITFFACPFPGFLLAENTAFLYERKRIKKTNPRSAANRNRIDSDSIESQSTNNTVKPSKTQ